MSWPGLIVAVLLAAAALACLVGSLGVLCMRDAFERLQYGALITAWGGLFMTIAVWITTADAEPRLKAAFAALVLFATNSVLASATAKAARIHEVGRWAPEPADKIEVIGRRGAAGDGAVEEHRA